MSTTLKNQIESFNNGTIIDTDGDSNTCFNFFDWFCQDKSLERKAIKLFKKVKTFVKKFDIDINSTYCFFKNNCPMVGPLYDDFRICDIESGDVLFTVTPKSGHNGEAEIWGKSNDFKEPLYSGTNLTEIYHNL